MNKENITSFDQIPSAISKILNELEIIKEQLAHVDSKTKIQTTPPTKKVLTTIDICSLLDMKRSTVYSLTHLNKIPYYRVNGRVYFDSDEIERWIHSDRHKTVRQLQDEADIQLKK